MDKFVYSNTEPSPPMDPPDPQLQAPGPVSPVPSGGSMKSDWSMGSPPNFSREPPQSNPKLQTPGPVSPVPSCVSMKSDWSMGSPPNFSREPPQSNPKLQTPGPVSPVPSCVSMKSDWSMGSPPNFSREPPQSNPKLQTPGPVSPVPSCVSMKSDWSMGSPPNFSREPPQSNPKLQTPGPVSPVPSGVSMKSDWSKGNPPNFSRGPPQCDPKLADCGLTEASCEIVASTMQSAIFPLRDLDLSNNDLQKSGRKLLIALQSPGCKLEVLRLVGCGLTEESGDILAFALQSVNSHLRELDLSENTLRRKLPSEALNPHCKLEKLRLVGCGLTEGIGCVLAFALQSLNSDIRELDLSKNTLGDCNGKLDLGTLNPHCKLKILRLNGCKLQDKQCEVLASAVQYMESLTDLDLSDSPVSLSGFKLINGALGHLQLQKLRLAGCGLTEESGGILAFALQSVHSHLRELDLSRNTLVDCGGQLRSEALNPHCRLEILSLGDCKLREKPCDVIASAAQSLVSLSKLDLSDNYISLSGIQILHGKCYHLKQPIPRYFHGENGRIKPEMRQYACELTLDPNTANRKLVLSEKNRKVTWVSEEQPYPEHPDRFDSMWQVLCRQGLSSHCYFEAEGSSGGFDIAVAYKSILRKGGSKNKGLFGDNDKSWSLWCDGYLYTARHKKEITAIPAPSPRSSRVGVYLDWSAGNLSFYSVSSDALTHLHTFHSTFTEPLYPGFRIAHIDSTVYLCQMTGAPLHTATAESVES